MICQQQIHVAEFPKGIHFNKVRQKYGWWKKSCTSWYGKYPIIYRVSYIQGGAGFLPSTVCVFPKIVGFSPQINPFKNSGFSMIFTIPFWWKHPYFGSIPETLFTWLAQIWPWIKAVKTPIVRSRLVPSPKMIGHKSCIFPKKTGKKLLKHVGCPTVWNFSQGGKF